MVKRTLYFGSSCYLSCKNEQLVYEDRGHQKIFTIKDENVVFNLNKIENEDRYEKRMNDNTVTIPIEDIGVMIIDHHGVSISQYLVSKLLENNVAIIFCNEKHHPSGLVLNLDGSSIQSERFKHQIAASMPLRKNLWQQTVSAKIRNQAKLLELRGVRASNMLNWADNVNSGDTKNHEARASVFYWKKLFPEELEFYRDRFGEPPNNFLNYGYAVLRAVVARGLVSSGLLPTLGIHHRNKYNSYCLADDIMEPYRPFVDKLVCELIDQGEDYYVLSPLVKKRILSLPTLDILISGERSPLMIGLQKTTSSLAKCYMKKNKKLIYPELI